MDPHYSNVGDCRLVELPQIRNSAGNLTALNGGQDIPFPIARVYYIYDVPGGSVRGGHAHRDLLQIIISLSGSFEVVLDDGKTKKTISLNKPNIGLLVCPGIWRDLQNFSSGSVCLVLASLPYFEADYIRDYNKFLEWKF